MPREEAVPLDGLPLFISQTWDIIRSQRDLNIPDQRDIVATFRCTEIKDEALKEVQEPIDELLTHSKKESIDDFKPRCEKIMNDASDYFLKNAHRYGCHEKFLGEVKEQVVNTLSKAFESQLEFVMIKIKGKFDVLLKTMSKEDIINDKFHK